MDVNNLDQEQKKKFWDLASLYGELEDRLGEKPGYSALEKNNMALLGKLVRFAKQNDTTVTPLLEDHFGYKRMRKEDGFWTKEQVILTYQHIENEIGFKPNLSWLKKNGHYGLIAGLDKVAKDQGITPGELLQEHCDFKPYKDRKNPWCPELIKERYSNLEAELGFKPSPGWLIKNDHGALYNALNKEAMASGITASEYLKNNFGFIPQNELLDHWTIEAVQVKYHELGGSEISFNELTKKDPELAKVIGMHARKQNVKISEFVNERLGGPIRTNREKGYWTVEAVVEEYLKVEKEVGFKPGTFWISRNGYGALLGGINQVSKEEGIRPSEFLSKYCEYENKTKISSNNLLDLGKEYLD